MFEFEATTYEILRYVGRKGDRPAKCVDQASFCGLEFGVTTLGRGLDWLRRSTPLCITQETTPV